MAPRRITGTAALAGTLIALATPSARAQPRMPTHVACVGDSITAGVGATSAAAYYPAQLQGLLGAGVVVSNFGYSGATLLSTGDLPYQRLASYTAATNFVANAGAGAVVDVIIMLGTNDSKPVNWNAGDGGTRAAQYASDYAAMVDRFTSLPTHPVVYLALPLDALANSFTISGSVIHDEIIPIIKQVAADRGMPTIDLNTPTAAHAAYFVDGVHPNNAGYVVVAGIMRDGLMRVPEVSLTSPTADATVTAPVIGVTAEASAGTVAITSVEFFADASSIGMVSQPPFTLSWSDVAPGSYALTATATDTTGAATTSDPVPITVIGGAPDAGSPAGGGGSSGCGGGCRLGSAGQSAPTGSGAAVGIAVSVVCLGTVVSRRRRRSGSARRSSC